MALFCSLCSPHTTTEASGATRPAARVSVKQTISTSRTNLGKPKLASPATLASTRKQVLVSENSRFLFGKSHDESQSLNDQLPGQTSSGGLNPGDKQQIDLSKLTPEQHNRLEAFLKMSGLGPLKGKTGKLDGEVLKKLQQHVHRNGSGGLGSGSSPRGSQAKDGLVRQQVLNRKKDEMIQLLDQGADPDDPEPKTMVTTLMLAAREGLKDYIEILVAKGADVNKRSHCGWSTRFSTRERCKKKHSSQVRPP